MFKKLNVNTNLSSAFFCCSVLHVCVVLFYAQIVIFKKLANLRGGEIDMLGSLLKSRKALSTVVTTLIILVVSVLLATVVTMYSINVTTTRVQEESLFLTKPHVWYNTTGSWSQAAIIIINTGGKDVVLDKVTVRGQELNWTYVFYWRTTTAITQDLEVTSDQLNISQTTQNITVEGQSRTFTRADSDLTLRSGWTMVLYIDSPDSITVSDVGTTVGITIFSASAQYYKEVNVQAAQ